MFAFSCKFILVTLLECIDSKERKDKKRKDRDVPICITKRMHQEIYAIIVREKMHQMGIRSDEILITVLAGSYFVETLG